MKRKIIGYFSHVNNILLITMKNLQTNLTLQEFNNIQSNVQLTIEKEQNKMNFLDITIQKTANYQAFGIYRRLTTTDTTIHNTSCHPIQQSVSLQLYNEQTEHISHGKPPQKY
jgi:hypothetical protein